MIKVTVFLCLVAMCAAQQYVWDILKPALNAEEVAALLTKGDQPFPSHASIPQTSFSCATKKNGFFADTEAQCQVFHRCDINGNQTSFLCVNQTVFNQITLVCDYWYNVDCEKFAAYQDFANSRLYTNLALFDTPPADYIPPGSEAKKPVGPSRRISPHTRKISNLDMLQKLQGTNFKKT